MSVPGNTQRDGSCDACACESEQPASSAIAPNRAIADFSGRLLALFGGVVVLVVALAVGVEWLGLGDVLRAWVPAPLWFAVILAGGYPIFRSVLRAASHGRITAHTLMTMGLIAALFVRAYPAAVLVVFFMRLAEAIEHFTLAHASRAVHQLAAMAPEVARVERDSVEIEVPVAQVHVGEIVVVRPGEEVPVDGVVISGQATVNQATITGESMPIEAGPGTRVFAASLAQFGHLRIRATEVGTQTTFGRVIRLVGEADKHRAPIQRIADRFATWYLPVVASIATLTFFFSGNALATAAVLMVACSCSFALATPVVMIASIGTSARNGLLIKGGRYLEALSKVDVVLLDKTGTLTLGCPQITDVVPLDGALDADELLLLAASAERYSEHPLADAVRAAASERGLTLLECERLDALPGAGVRAHVNGGVIAVGSQRFLQASEPLPVAAELEAAGKTLLFVMRDDQLIGVLAAMDALRPEVPAALMALRELGIRRLELLTGDNTRTASAAAQPLGLPFRAGLMPDDKIAIVREYQRDGHVVAMVGDGVNDAPALAQADVGIAMGAAGSAVAIEAAHIALMREDWSLVPEVVHIARRAMNAVQINLGFTVIYNLTGLTLASLGVLPPTLAAAAQAGPDFGILANSARLLRRGRKRPQTPDVAGTFGHTSRAAVREPKGDSRDAHVQQAR
ncbi:heavy metal translocating P-type ATPase [Ralstonia pseudosolanacearum]|uniref:heavy metal translocating P-type ATPase n=1 Tax=Ralstonia pseudosolanacearum TaxID=1310165 RepID=UPI0009C1086B|nr:cation-translocating P-type ATPase [Ralstonia pseudosolanacearum]NKA07767.1 copper-translocating P-type ATPase [Ralstonia solanacearum]QWF61535.1 cation-translocating P-type ATPase [Ralstonia solanacearum]